ncbi:solute carrier family 35 member G1 isoform X2 [Eurytemora carolleeae]|uniref:solute carrier family 35 member G1 isoform X2 n=1 Tax=Eurytemora carolleeae TaxID=1294199 RepID=UPI000C7845A0|nr:solute carrier family 35 member G1 isoform X2 [Eurytemora carolleeae]|eukprot:XP_023342119.1 solute carrier family 35 member G1-like isoform X2 [Eurytemora affinis]
MSKPNLENSYIQRTALNTEQDEQNIENSRLLAGNSSSNSDENRKLSPKGMSLKTPENEIPRKIRVYQGVFLSILSGVLFTANNFIIKHFNVVPGDAVLVRGLVQVLLLLGFSVSKNYQILPTESRIFCFVILQSVLGGLSFISALICVSLMPVADALVIMFSSPLATMAVAAIFLGERFNMLRIMMGLSILAGVTLVCKPPLVFPSFQIQNDTINGSSEEMFINSTEDVLKSTFLDDGTPEVVHDTTYWTGAGFAMAAVLTGTFHNITVPACKNVASTVLVLYVGVLAILISAISAQFNSQCMIATGFIAEVQLEMWGVLFGLAISGMIAYLSLTRALQLVSPTIVSSLRALEIVFAYVAESLILFVLPSLLSALGASLVVLGVVGIALEGQILEYWRKLRPDTASKV